MIKKRFLKYGNGVFYRGILGINKYPIYRFEARGSVADYYIYRCRRGNGWAGSALGWLYHDIYNYFVPSSRDNPESEFMRNLFWFTSSLWKYFDDETKSYWNARASVKNMMSGFNLYVKSRVDYYKYAIYDLCWYECIVYDRNYT